MIPQTCHVPAPPDPGWVRSVLLPPGMPGTAALHRILTLGDTGTLQASHPTPRRKTIELTTHPNERDGLWGQLQQLMSMDRFQQRADAVGVMRKYTQRAACYGDTSNSPAIRNLQANACEVYDRCQAEGRGLELKEVRPCLEGLVQKRVEWWAAESAAIRKQAAVRPLAQNSAGLHADCTQLVRRVHPLKTDLVPGPHIFELCMLLLNSMESHIRPAEIRHLDSDLIGALTSCVCQIGRVSSVAPHVQESTGNPPPPPVSVALFSPAERFEALAWGTATEHALAQAGFSNQKSQLNELGATLVQRMARLSMPYQSMLGFVREGSYKLAQKAAEEFIASFQGTVTQLRLLQAVLKQPEYRQATPAVFKSSTRELRRGVGRLLACLDDIQRPFQAAVRFAQHLIECPYSSVAALRRAMKWPADGTDPAQ